MTEEWVEGFVITFNKIGVPTFHNALKEKRRNKVARYTKSGKGVWCGKAVGGTFFEHPWNPAPKYDDLHELYSKRVEKLKWVAELDRLMPRNTRGYWYDRDAYFCKMCGNVVFDRPMHFKEHMSTNPYSIKFAETVTLLFGYPDPEPPTYPKGVLGPPRTQDEKIAFRKEWDRRVDEGRKNG